MKQYRICYRPIGGTVWFSEHEEIEELIYSKRKAEYEIKEMEYHFERFPGEKMEQKIQLREVSEWRDETV